MKVYSVLTTDCENKQEYVRGVYTTLKRAKKESLKGWYGKAEITLDQKLTTGWLYRIIVSNKEGSLVYLLTIKEHELNK